MCTGTDIIAPHTQCSFPSTCRCTSRAEPMLLFSVRGGTKWVNTRQAQEGRSYLDIIQLICTSLSRPTTVCSRLQLPSSIMDQGNSTRQRAGSLGHLGHLYELVIYLVLIKTFFRCILPPNFFSCQGTFQ